MTEQVKKRVQITLDKGIAESADYIIKAAGLTPAAVISLLYTEISRTGEIPVKPEVTPQDRATAKLIAASYQPGQKVESDEEIDAFMDDDGGY